MSKKLLVLLLAFLSVTSYGQFFSSPPTIDGSIDLGYGTGPEGWAMGWDDNYLYLRKTTTNSQPVIVYLDVNPIVPVSGGENSNGSLTGATHWGITPTLPFRADFTIYWDNSHLQYQTANGSGGWNTVIQIGTPDRTNGIANKECRIPWSVITGSGRPSALNWLGYCNSRVTPGYIFHPVPAANLNPIGVISNPRFFGYYAVVNTTNSGTTNPFAENQISFETRSVYSYTSSMPSPIWDMTINAPSETVDLIIERDVEVRNRLDIATPFSHFRASGGERTITMSGSNGALRNIGGTMFGEFEGSTMSLVVSGTTELFSSGNFINFRNFTINNGATLIANNVQMSSNSGTGSFTVNGTLRTSRSNGLYGANDFTILSNNLSLTLESASTIEYNAAGSQTITTTNNYANLIVSGSGTKTPNGNIGITGDLNVAAGTLDLGTFTANRSTSGGVFTLGASTTLNIAGTNTLPANYASHAFNASSTVNYNGTNQTIAPLSGSAQYGNIILSGSGNKVLGGNVAVANDLTVQTGVALTVASGQNLTVTDQLINSGGTVTLQNNANLIQSGTTNTNSGAITVNRDSFSLKRLDYTLWSAPVAAQNLLAFSPLTMANRFYTYNPSSNQYNAITPSSNNFATGVGYLIRMPDNHPTSPTVWNGQFSGLPNNGDVTISVTNNTYNAVGNPYPSTIDADDFINDNNLTEALYFWRKTNGDPGSAYATYTLAGGAGTGPSDSNAQVPNGIIQVGQGFIARSTSTSLVFNNGMRVANNANQFFRSASETEQNRIRVQTTGPNGFYGEVLVNYMTGATNGIDAALDGKYINDSEDALFTIVETEPYIIQARALPFDVSDVVPLGFKTTQNGTFTFNMTQNDGLFESDYQVFLNDKQLNVVHPFADGAYSFVSNAGTFNERFELIFEEGALSVNNPKANKEDVIVFQQNGNWQIQSLNTPLQSIEVVEVTGKQLLFKTGLTQMQESIFLTVNAPQLLLVKIGLQNGQTLLKKIVVN